MAVQGSRPRGTVPLAPPAVARAYVARFRERVLRAACATEDPPPARHAALALAARFARRKAARGGGWTPAELLAWAPAGAPAPLLLRVVALVDRQGRFPPTPAWQAQRWRNFAIICRKAAEAYRAGPLRRWEAMPGRKRRRLR